MFIFLNFQNNNKNDNEPYGFYPLDKKDMLFLTFVILFIITCFGLVPFWLSDGFNHNKRQMNKYFEIFESYHARKDYVKCEQYLDSVVKYRELYNLDKHPLPDND